ncbi:uncharacterized protein TNCT_434001 [Trichonephila clavata]|uniref:Mutator-like transposase domain-containing protein n=1 Tax=Trichonephila clavata TaxID=2740835 RepID=A0A8X6G6N1_TRICU|nr:uncharacterized protein TNCT_434001 [Trichonephila clavata]
MPRAKTFGHQKRRLIRKKTSVCVVSEKCDVSSSKKKIEKSKGYFDYEDNFSAESQSRFVIIDLNMLNDIFNNIAKCRYCDRSFCFDVAENKSSRRGLASSISATCKYCGSSHGSMTSNSVPAGYEVNLRFVYGMRCIGNGKSAAQTFCALMNLPPPPAKFERLYTPIFNALETASSRSMEEVRAVIRYEWALGVSGTEIHNRLEEVYGPGVMSNQMVRRWCRTFSDGRQQVEDIPRAGRTRTATTDANVGKKFASHSNERLSSCSLQQRLAREVDAIFIGAENETITFCWTTECLHMAAEVIKATLLWGSEITVMIL